MCSFDFITVLSLLMVQQCKGIIFHTNETHDFNRQTINCPSGEPCAIYCDFLKDGGVCELSTINCPPDSQCDLYCGPGHWSCRTATINCPLSADCNIHCSETVKAYITRAGGLICDNLRPKWSSNAQGTLTCEGAGASMCSNIDSFPIPPPNEDMVLNCEAEEKCAYSSIICPSNADCTINCDHNKACIGAHITWSVNGINTLNCNATYTDPCLNVTLPTRNLTEIPTTDYPTTGDPTTGDLTTDDPTVSLSYNSSSSIEQLQEAQVIDNTTVPPQTETDAPQHDNNASIWWIIIASLVVLLFCGLFIVGVFIGCLRIRNHNQIMKQQSVSDHDINLDKKDAEAKDTRGETCNIGRDEFIVVGDDEVNYDTKGKLSL